MKISHVGFLGKKHTDEWKKRMSDYHKGKKISEETKRKIGLANKGKKPRLGSHLSEETKNKISKSEKGKLGSFGMLGKHHTEEWKIKMSVRYKGEKGYFYGKRHTDESKLKISIAKIGKKRMPLSLETRKKISVANSGEKSYNWKGGIWKGNNKIRKSLEYKIWRESVFTRDNYTCKKCKRRGYKIDPHHILNFSSHLDLRFNIENGITLCRKCHNNFHNKYGKINNTAEQLKEYLKH